MEESLVIGVNQLQVFINIQTYQKTFTKDTIDVDVLSNMIRVMQGGKIFGQENGVVAERVLLDDCENWRTNSYKIINFTI